jgi:hypothetical protein
MCRVARLLCLALMLASSVGALAQEDDRAGTTTPAPAQSDDVEPGGKQTDAPDEFDPTEEVSIDFPVDFPTDI